MSKIKLVINNTNQQREKEKFFIKKELQSILNLYAKMVSNGSWKDYSFSSGIKEVSFDRNGYLYHGRVKSLADGAREGGLKF